MNLNYNDIITTDGYLKFCPKIAIDSFLLCYEGLYKLLEKDTQVIIKIYLQAITQVEHRDMQEGYIQIAYITCVIVWDKL